jgi:zinc D-Ala-D-Ala carboxypeptidase
MIDDIPEARREPIEIKKSSGSPLPLLLLMGSGFLVVAIAFCVIWFLNRPIVSVSQEKSVTKITSPVDAPKKETPQTSSQTLPESPSELPSESPQKPAETVDNLLGHLPYKEASKSELVPITSDGSILLQAAAAEKFRQMEADARAQGVNLAVISGFRSVEAQNSLFFDVKEQRVQGASKRAEVSAPPGYSEHHTGYAVDLGDANVPATHLNPEFEKTAAFQWLQQNAAKYSFELSFPKDNPQGISYEPWHWRFVGDRQSLETFYKAKNLKRESRE